MAGLLDALVGSIVMSLIATAALYGIIWMFRNGRRRNVLTARPFVAPVFPALRNFARRANRALRFRTVGTERNVSQTAAYVIWNQRLPITRKVLEQIRGLAKSNEPFSGLLVSSHPATIKMTENGPMPIVTCLIAVKDLDASNLSGTACDDMVATFHTHRSSLETLEHDERLFRVIDAFAGPKLHIVGSAKGLQFYRARNPVVIKRDNKTEVRSTHG